MNIVALETSGRDGSLAAMAATESGPTQLWELPLEPDRRSAQTLPAALATLLSRAGWRAGQVDAVAVASGPGSFTGLRVGVTAAKMLAYVARAGVVEVNTLAVIAAQARASARGAVWAVIDAQRGELFATRLEPGADAAPHASVELLTAQQWLARLEPGDVVSGPGVGRLVDRLPEGVEATDATQGWPRAATVAELAAPLALAGDTLPPERLVPRYHRLSAAEEKRLRELGEA